MIGNTAAPGMSPQAQLKRLAGDKKNAAQAQAVWVAVGMWSRRRRPDRLPDHAVSEVLASYRRNLAGQPMKPVHGYGALHGKALDIRQEWQAAGSPNIVPAILHTCRYLRQLQKGARP